jgi:hypothetical protein
MDTQVRVRWQFSEKSKIQNVLERLKNRLWEIANIIASCREAQARRRIQLYFYDQWIDELTEAGTRIAKKDVNDCCNSEKNFKK